MAGMGPAPKNDGQRRRRNQTSAPTVQLPASGRTGDVPEWPFDTSQTGELAMWRDLWRLPQAVAWEQQCLSRVVARYVRALREAERPQATASIMGEVRQLEDRLGLSSMALLRLRWEIVDDSGSAVSSGPSDVDVIEFAERMRRKAFGAASGGS